MAAVSQPILSTKSKQYQRDTFLYCTSLPARLLIGLNQRLTPINSATLQRWIYELAPHRQPFHLRPVTLHQFGIMAYAIKPSGPSIPENSLEPLPTGNYGLYRDADSRESKFIPQIATVPNSPSFAAMKQTTTSHPNPEAIFDVIPSVAQAVQERDRNQCFITGTSLQGDIDLVWMFPPTFYHLCRYPPLRDDYKRIPEFFETASNAAFLHKDLIPFFLDNTFSVDVDNHHVFRDMGPAQNLLPSHLQVTANEGPDD